ncbi:MAG: hypothetical protein RJA70_1127 [Pseudomonadota bacterium]|jgi:4-hydroxybenzoate polyprenyltransferase
MSSSPAVVEIPQKQATAGVAALLLLLLMPAMAALDVLAVELYLGDRVRPLTLLMVGALALFVYALNGLTDSAEDAVNDPVGSAGRRQHAFWTLGSSTSVLVGAGSVMWGRGELSPIYAVLIAVGVVYSVRVVPWPSARGVRWVRLKDVVLLKNLAIGGTWAAAVFAVPVIELPFAPAKPQVLALVGLGYAAISAVNSIYSDMRDEAGDRQAGVNTLPVRFGASNCHRGIFIAMSAWVALLLWCFASGVIDGGHLWLLSSAALGYPLTVWWTKEHLRLSRTACNYVVETSDLLFCLGLLVLAI